ncbi:hypothetical protein HY085_00585 [Candidatus Gottesmanbacteria bacterium]|nr:hypothetical protein [Candidatus Gottesmanbacteria bacterium]
MDESKGYKSLPFYLQSEIIYDYKGYMAAPETAANAMICLINQTNQLLDSKLRWLQDDFVKNGGFRENLLKKRLEYRKNLIT